MQHERDLSMHFTALQNIWKQRIMYRFQNGRKREHQDIPEVQARKRVKKNTPSDTTGNQSSSKSWGLPNYLPKREEGEDDMSVKKHTEFLKVEKQKKKPNYERVCMLMQKTFADRRQFIVTGNETILAVQQEYPWLFQEEEVCMLM